MSEIILITGANGQLGSVLTPFLQEKHGINNVIASDIYKKDLFNGIFEIIDATDIKKLNKVVLKYKVTVIYHLAAILSANGERSPLNSWNINTTTWFNVLETSRINSVNKIFFPSSIAVFGPSALKELTPNKSIQDPTTVYGMSKSSGELWASYYNLKYNLDIRSIRYPGVISYQSVPQGGTTDYAVDIFHKAIEGKKFNCNIKASTIIPMIYINDAVRATDLLMEAPSESIKVRTSYNVSGVSFSPIDLVNKILKIIPEFKIEYNPDICEKIASQWPNSINDEEAKNDWGWKPEYSLEKITHEMIKKLKTP